MIEQEENDRKMEMKKYLDRALKNDPTDPKNEKEKDKLKEIMLEQLISD